MSQSRKFQILAFKHKTNDSYDYELVPIGFYTEKIKKK